MQMVIHIEERLDAAEIERLKKDLRAIPHVQRVELNPAVPHDLMVEYDERHNMPMKILNRLEGRGLHPDLQPC